MMGVLVLVLVLWVSVAGAFGDGVAEGFLPCCGLLEEAGIDAFAADVVDLVLELLGLAPEDLLQAFSVVSSSLKYSSAAYCSSVHPRARALVAVARTFNALSAVGGSEVDTDTIMALSA